MPGLRRAGALHRGRQAPPVVEGPGSGGPGQEDPSSSVLGGAVMGRRAWPTAGAPPRPSVAGRTPRGLGSEAPHGRIAPPGDLAEKRRPG